MNEWMKGRMNEWMRNMERMKVRNESKIWKNGMNGNEEINKLMNGMNESMN